MSYGSIDRPKPVPAAQLLEMLGMILDDQFLRRLAQVPQESLGHFQAVHDAAGHDRQIPERIVAAPLLELGGETARSSSARPSPNCRCAAWSSRRAICRSRPDRLAAARHERVEVRVERRLVELVAFQTQSRSRRRPRVGARAAAAEAQDRPLPAGTSQASRPSGCRSIGQHDDILRRE